MSNFNKVLLMGNLTRDPELRYTAGGTAIARFGMAINRMYKAQDGEQKKETCFVDVSMFGRRAEVISEYFSKGSSIFIEGRLRFEQWESQDGQKRNRLSVMAENFEFVGSSQKNNDSSAFAEEKMPMQSEKPISDNNVSNSNVDDVPF